MKDENAITPIDNRIRLTHEARETICAEIADGKSMRVACQLAGVHPSTFYRELSSDEALRDNYARARDAQADKLAGEIVEIADELHIEARYDGDGVKLDLSSNMVARNRLRVDARKWAASKLAPKKYGDRLEVDNKLSGGVTIKKSADDYSDDELMEIALRVRA